MEEGIENYSYSVGPDEIPTTRLGSLANAGDFDAVQASLPINWEVEKEALLHAAVHGGKYEVVKLLVENGAPIDGHAFYIAYRFGLSKIFQLLQQIHPECKIKRKSANNILLDAARSGDVAMVEWALAKGADVNAIDYFYGFPGWTSLHHGSLMCSHELIQILVAHGADVTQQTDQAQTPIMLCISSSTAKISRSQRKDCVQLLIESGAQLSQSIDWFSSLLAKQGFRIST